MFITIFGGFIDMVSVCWQVNLGKLNAEISGPRNYYIHNISTNLQYTQLVRQINLEKKEVFTS